jgi:hypothetical protein
MEGAIGVTPLPLEGGEHDDRDESMLVQILPDGYRIPTALFEEEALLRVY